MKSLKLYLGSLGCGKSHIAKEECQREQGSFIETSDLVKEVAIKTYGRTPTRQELQELKFKLAENPRWLIDLLLAEIENASSDKIFISGLREVALYEELNAVYGIDEVIIVVADPALRQQRRQLTDEEFIAASQRDDQLGLNNLLELVKPKARFVHNNFEYSNI